MKFFEEKNIQLIEWPPQSPDLKLIENLWSIIKQKLQDFDTSTISSLKESILEIWNSIPIKMCQNLVLSIKNRIFECIREKEAIHHTNFANPPFFLGTLNKN